jgi:hypothetical protein
LLHQGSDFRVYYGTRNGSFFETHCQPGNRWVYALNRAVYLGVLTVLACLQGKKTRLALVRQAIDDGALGRLGENSKFTL